MSGLILGVDIGRTGALAMLTPDLDLIECEDLPVLADGPAYRLAINPTLLANLIRRWRPSAAFVEHVSARPGEAPSGSISFGRSRGTIEGVLAALDVPTTFLTPACWKRTVGVPPGADKKDMARSIAIRRWPGHADLFARSNVRIRFVSRRG